MTIRDLFNFVYPDIKHRNLILSLMTRIEWNDEGRIRLYHGYEDPKKISLSDFDKVVKKGYYLYFKYAHFDDEIFCWYDRLEKANKDYETENIHKTPSLIMAKKILRVENDSIEEIKADKWKD